jgi:hypothetical protein
MSQLTPATVREGAVSGGDDAGEAPRSDWDLALVLGVLALILYAFAARLRFVNAIPAGDEPHYLIINLALQKYHTIDVMPVYLNRDYWSFYPAVIAPHLSPGPNGPLPLHNIGGPLLWHLPFLLFGRAGAMGFIVVVSALTVVNIFFFLRELGIVRPYAATVTALFAIGSPIYMYSSLLFIEPIAALAVLYAVRVLIRPRLQAGRMAVASTGLGVLPWVHGRFIVFSVLIGALLAWRVWREVRLRSGWPYVWCLGPLVLLLAGMEVFNLVVWHSLHFAPNMANYGAAAFQIPVYKGVAGALFERHFGLLPNFPLFALVLPGLLLSLRRGLRQLHGVMIVAIVPYVLAVCSFSAWWAGYSPPARYLATITPLLAYYVAVVLQRLHHWLVIVLAVLASLAAFVLAVVSDITPTLRFHADPRTNHAMQELGRLIGMRFEPYLPNAFAPGGQPVRFVLLALLVVMFGVVVWALGRRAPQARLADWSVRLVGR